MIRRLALLSAVLASMAAAAAPALAAPTLRLDGIGPLRLGMSSSAALRSGWLGGRQLGCKLGGPPYPVTYTFSGSRAPAGVVGVAEFGRGKLRSLSFSRGVRTATGVVAGVTPALEMANSYKDAGFAARAVFSDMFGGTFVHVKRGGKRVIGGFARGRPSARRAVSTLAIPFVAICE